MENLTIESILEFIASNRAAVSWTFTMTVENYHQIAADLISKPTKDIFKSFRVDLRKGEHMPYQYRTQKNIIYWVQVTISK